MEYGCKLCIGPCTTRGEVGCIHILYNSSVPLSVYLFGMIPGLFIRISVMSFML
jgi:hypothetical protein